MMVVVTLYAKHDYNIICEITVYLLFICCDETIKFCRVGDVNRILDDFAIDGKFGD